MTIMNNEDPSVHEQRELPEPEPSASGFDDMDDLDPPVLTMNEVPADVGWRTT